MKNKMYALKLVLCVMTLGCVAASHAPNIVTCYRNDLHCVKNIINQITNGFPEYGISSKDTVIIPELKFECGLTLKNIVVSGLGNQNIHEFKVLHDRRTIRQSFGAQLQIHADAVLESQVPVHHPWYPILRRLYHGRYQATANTLGSSLYTTDIKNIHGVEHYFLGPETTVTQLNGTPQASLIFDEEHRVDPHGVSESVLDAEGEQFHHRVISQIASAAYSNVLTNIRSITALLPRRTFYYDL